MKKQHTHAADAALLRQKAEEQLKLQQSYSGSLSAKTNIPNLLHELQVHQIELQMQNEELIVAKEKAELAQIKYSDIYSLAPIGILTLTEEGIISELNFVATGMLGKERSILVNKWFAIFVSDDTKATFRETLNKALNSRQKQSADITLIVDGKEPLIVHFSCIQIETTRHYLITLVDITERIQALEKLKESEEKYHLLFENMISGFQLNEVIVDENNIPVDFRIIDGNTNLQQYTGYSIEESRGKTIKEMMPISK